MAKTLGQIAANLIPKAGEQPGTVKISSTQILPQLLPTLNVGDLLRFNVRSNPADGPGTLYTQGQLIQTQLPDNVNAGDKLLARLEHTGDQVLFKILEHSKSDGTILSSRGSDSASLSGSSGTTVSAFDQLVDQIESILRRASQPSGTEATSTTLLDANLGESSRPLAFADSLSQVTELKDHVDQLAQSIGSNEALADGKAVAARLAQAAQGTPAELLRETANAIRTLLNQTPNTSPTTDRFLTLLREQISSVLDSFGREGLREATTRQVDSLLHAVNEELKLQKRPSGTREGDVLKLVLTDLKLAKEHPEQLERHMESALNRLQQYAPGAESDQAAKIDPKTAGELQVMASRLESLASAHEALSQMNPVMQALGEPAMILFPFIMQGLLHHGEISVDPDAKGNQQKGKGEKDSTGDGYQRIQVRVPLPSMGMIDADIATRGSEIITSFTVQDEAAAEFLSEQLESLRALLSRQDFTLVEFSSRAGSKSSETNTERDENTIIV